MTEVEKVLEKWGEIMVKQVKFRLEQNNKINTGNLINSITYEYSDNNGVYTLKIVALDYIKYVEYGRPRGSGWHKGSYVPITPLIQWIKRKKIPVDVPKGMKREQAIRGMAFAISKKVYKRGFQREVAPVPFIKEATVLNSPQFKKEIKDAVLAEVKKLIKR